MTTAAHRVFGTSRDSTSKCGWCGGAARRSRGEVAVAGGTPHRLSKGLSCSIPVGDRWATGEMSSRRLASLALIAHGQPRPSTRFAAPPLRSGPAGDRRDRPCTHRLRASQGRLALNSTAGATTASPSVVARQVFERTAVSRSRGHSLGTGRVEAGSIAEHRAGDVEQAVGHRTQGTGVSVAAGAQSAVLAVAHRITLGSHPSPVEDDGRYLALTRLPWQLSAFVLSAFGALAPTLDAVGLYGVVSYGVARRSREIGIRTALGADRPCVVRLLVAGGPQAGVHRRRASG